eukprot:s291_g9.t1
MVCLSCIFWNFRNVPVFMLHTIRLSQDLASKFHSLGMRQANPSRQSVDFDAAPRCQLEENFRFHSVSVKIYK